MLQLLAGCALVFAPYLLVIALGRAQKKDTGTGLSAAVTAYILTSSFLLLLTLYLYHFQRLTP